MNPKDITVDQVVEELSQIVAKYPDRIGGDKDWYEGSDGQMVPNVQCVYYKDAHGYPVSDTFWDGVSYELVTPVCIVGQWIEDFHPEWKNDEVVSSVLYKNSVIATLSDESNPFTSEVRNVLGEIQVQQDDGKPWQLLNLDLQKNRTL